MNRDSAIIIFQSNRKKIQTDIEVPLDITATELVMALNTAYDLGIDTSDIKNCYLKSESPIALLRGNKTLAQFGIRNGSVIMDTEQG